MADVKELAKAITDEMLRQPDEATHSKFMRAIASGGAPYAMRGAFGDDSRPYSLLRVVDAIRSGTWENAKVEWGISEALEQSDFKKLSGMAGDKLGFLVPLDPVEIEAQVPALKGLAVQMEVKAEAFDPAEIRRVVRAAYQKDLEVSDSSLGGYLVGVGRASTVIELLRNRLALSQAGAREIPLPPSGNLEWPTVASGASFTWRDPDAASDSSLSDMAFGVLRLMAKQLFGALALPNDLIRYSSPSAELIVRQDLAEGAAVAEDSTFLEALGSSLQPKGLINWTGIIMHDAKTQGADGNTYEPEDVAAMIGKVEDANGVFRSWIMRGLMFAGISNRRADAVSAGDGAGPFMFPTTRGTLGGPIPPELAGYPVAKSAQVSNTRSKGSASNLTYILGGDFQRAVIGRVGAIELAASEHLRFLRDQTVLRAILRSDFGLTHPGVFAMCDDLVIG